MYSETCLIRLALGNKCCVGIESVRIYSGKSIEMKIEWRLDYTMKHTTRVSNYTSFSVYSTWTEVLKKWYSRSFSVLQVTLLINNFVIIASNFFFVVNTPGGSTICEVKPSQNQAGRQQVHSSDVWFTQWHPDLPSTFSKFSR